MSLAGRLALVTGAGRGAGRAVALALGRAGAHVVAVDVNPDTLQSTLDAIRAEGGTAEGQAADISNKLALQTALYDVLEAHPRIDILVSAAQVVPHSPALRLDEWEWNRTLDVNLKGAFLAAQTAARAMRETGGGIILNVIRPAGASPHAAVRAAREGLAGLTAVLAAEWAEYNIRVETLDAAGDLAAEAVRRCERFDWGGG